MSKDTEWARREAAAVRPSPRQLAWQELEFIGFCHFGVNTFTNREWGEGNENPAIFNPTQFDARQWAAVARDAGMKMLIITAKHHDGFCLWPSRHTEHSVKNSPWREGRGDVVGDVARACREAGLKFGVYLSPWDRHEPAYGDSPAYNAHFLNQLRELLTQYGPIGEVWFDGACAEGPNGKRQEYDWAAYHNLIRELQPEAAIAICGPDVRWVGNEDGLARETEWSVVGVDFDDAPKDYNNEFYNYCLSADGRSGSAHGNPGLPERLAAARRLAWWPAEADVSIRPGWFYHPEEDLRVKSIETLVDIYYRSVGRNSVLLLNVPPDRRGLIHEHDAARLRELRRALNATFSKNLAKGATITASPEKPGFPAASLIDGDDRTWWEAHPGSLEASIQVEFAEPTTFNCIMLQEHLSLGQRVEEFHVDGWHEGKYKPIAQGTTIGHKRLLRFGEVSTSRLRVSVTKARAEPALRALEIYCARGASTTVIS